MTNQFNQTEISWPNFIWRYKVTIERLENYEFKYIVTIKDFNYHDIIFVAKLVSRLSRLANVQVLINENLKSKILTKFYFEDFCALQLYQTLYPNLKSIKINGPSPQEDSFQFIFGECALIDSIPKTFEVLVSKRENHLHAHRINEEILILQDRIAIQSNYYNPEDTITFDLTLLELTEEEIKLLNETPMYLKKSNNNNNENEEDLENYQYDDE